MLLVFSRHSNQSVQVQREVERAGNSGKVILPLRIDDVLPEEALEYYLSTPHWLDAITKPFEAHLEKLADACTSLLAVTGSSPSQPPPESDHPADSSLATVAAVPTTGRAGAQPISTSAKAVIGVAVAGAVIVGTIAGYQLIGGNSQSSNTSEAVTTSQPVASSQPVNLVAADALSGLLLSPDQVKTAMGATGMTVVGPPVPTSTYDDSAAVADKACLPLNGPAEAAAYAGSGSGGVLSQVLHEPGDTYSRVAIQAVVLFSSAHDAGAFFTASAQSWPACSNRQYTLTRAGKPDEVWSVGPISNTNGVLSATRTRGDGSTCKRALTVANNVAIDVAACSSYTQSDSAVTIAQQIAAKVPT
jgi:hypothetical protein